MLWLCLPGLDFQIPLTVPSGGLLKCRFSKGLNSFRGDPGTEAEAISHTLTGNFLRQCLSSFYAGIKKYSPNKTITTELLCCNQALMAVTNNNRQNLKPALRAILQ